MKLSRYFIACSLMLLVAMGAVANNTNRWEFTNANNYAYNPILINVDTNPPGEALLILQSDSEYHTTGSEYAGPGALTNLSYGDPGLLQLIHSGGNGYYAAEGTYESRPMFSPVGWKCIDYRVSNMDFLPAGVDPSADMLQGAVDSLSSFEKAFAQNVAHIIVCLMKDCPSQGVMKLAPQ